MIKIFLGIGNPGKKYEDTRHNVGFTFVSALKEQFEFSEWRQLGTSEVHISEGTINGESVVCALSQTFMNRSGDVARALLQEYAVTSNELLVFHDDLDVPIGTWKFSCGRGAGGHNGVRSLISALATKEFCRIRIGISPKTFFGMIKKPPREKVDTFVLGKMSTQEKKKINDCMEEILEVSRQWVGKK
jgi:PTH1 family peptidyl-tRNA hydrolase